MRVVGNGWIEGRPSQRLLAYALARAEEGDALKPNTLRNVASREKRARGYVAEAFVHAWLQSCSREFRHNGGPDPLPDFELAGKRIGVRLCAASGRFERWHRIYVFERHVGTVDAWFFCGVEMDTNRYLLLGGIDRSHFLLGAVRVEAGGLVCRGFVAEEPVRVRRVGDLTNPYQWLDEL